MTWLAEVMLRYAFLAAGGIVGFGLAALSKAIELEVPMPEARWVRQLYEKHRAAPAER